MQTIFVNLLIPIVKLMTKWLVNVCLVTQVGEFYKVLAYLVLLILLLSIQTVINFKDHPAWNAHMDIILVKMDYAQKLIQAARLSIKIMDNVQVAFQALLYHREDAIHKLSNLLIQTVTNSIQIMSVSNALLDFISVQDHVKKLTIHAKNSTSKNFIVQNVTLGMF